ncbi:MAG: cell division protein FtsZ [Synergistaceae bacterium]|nr:cell division protein FtsZ [Synergistaceae bacterium]
MNDVSEIFQLDKSSTPTREVIKVVGVGGAGNNALNHIIRGGVKGVEFIAANTDMAHLELSEAPTQMILGKELTKGLGAGSDPEVGFKSALESREEIRASVEGSDMVFIAAGMGGGTGTGAAPVIASIAKEVGALVVAVVTLPFTFEGKRRVTQAESGVKELKSNVDALIVIPNDKLLSRTDNKTSINDAFKLADGVLHQAVQGVTDLILRPGLVNVDFADVKTIMSNAGSAIMGIGEGYGEKRAATAAYNAINNPLMDTRISGAKGILFNITGGANVGIHEIDVATRIITEAADDDAFIIWGHVFDPDMDDAIQITVIAAGFDDTADKQSTNPLPKTNVSSNAFSASRRNLDISAVKNLNMFSIAKANSNIDVTEAQDSQISTKSYSNKQMDLYEKIPQEKAFSDVSENEIAVSSKFVPRQQMTQVSDEDLFKQSGTQENQYDMPTLLRKKLGSE